MATHKQKRARRRRAQEHTNKAKIAVANDMLDDAEWLNQGKHYGLDPTCRDQLLDAAAVGLTVLCWRNTSLEDVHAGEERHTRLQREGQDPDDPAVAKKERHAERAHYEALDADWTSLADADPHETRRLAVFLDGRVEGFGIPDDIMMRLNVSTALDVRGCLDATLPASVIEPGTRLGYDRRTAPDHVVDLVSLLQDPDRLLTVGGTTVAAGSILGDSWNGYTEDVMSKISLHLKYCDVLGARRAVWQIALSGVSYASGWYPNPWWTRAVDVLRRADADGRAADVFVIAEQAADIPAPLSGFWNTLQARPATLNGPQCEWIQRTTLDAQIRQVRDSDRDRLQPSGDRKFGPSSALF